MPVLTQRRSVVPPLPAVERALETAWQRSTSSDPDRWSPENPAWGQCAVTALILQDYYGGQLRRGLVDAISHYWNVLDDGHEVDLTLRQFEGTSRPIGIEPRERSFVLSFPETRARYDRLRAAVDQVLADVR